MTHPEIADQPISGVISSAVCPVVGIGASAGGFEAVTELLQELPATFDMAVVLVQHLDPNHESSLAELLAHQTPLTVVQATEGVQVEAGHVFVIPPNALMAIRDCKLVLSPRGKDRAHHLPIDHFMCSLAEDLGNRSIGVILSGGGSDGTIGLEAIKSEGGITFAQDQTAKHESMPRSAASTGLVDFVLNPREIARELTALTAHIQTAVGASGTVSVNGPILQRILATVRDRSGVDFTHYKVNTVQRRLARRMALHHLHTPEKYLELLEENDREALDFFEDILITVTDFFRDPETFESLIENALPLILEGRSSDDPIRAWVPGCSTGKEVYSVAIALSEAIENSGRACPLQIFGTDISDRSVDIARLGKYPQSISASVSPERLERFFVRIEGGYQIARRIREICVFSRQDVTRDPPLARMDLISCRNLLIYLGPILQRRVLGIFGYALKHGGFLLLGNSEAIGSLSDHFKPLDLKHRIYRRDGGAPNLILPDFPAVPLRLPPVSRLVPPVKSEANGLDHLADGILLEEYAPPGFLLNSQRQVVSFRGDVGSYLARPTGPESLDVLQLVAPQILEVLRPTLDAAMATASVARGRFLAGDDLVEVIVRPVIEPRTECHYLVIFEAPMHQARRGQISEARVKREEGEGRSVGDLALDLASTRAYMQRLVEELRSSNEEAQSANEELQSTNEELQTAKEELQSSNEELATTNEEMQSRNVQLGLVNADLVNLLSSLHLAILMLDRDLRIRRYTPLCEPLFNMIPGDLGRPISDLRAGIDIPHLIDSLRSVIDSGVASDSEVQNDRGHWYSVRLQPYRTAAGAIDGVVLQMFDIDGLKSAGAEIEKARSYAAAIVATVRESLVVLDAGLRVQTVNDSFCSMFGATQAHSTGLSVYELGGGRWNILPVKEMLDSALRGESMPDVELEDSTGVGVRRTLALSARRIGSDSAGASVLLTIEDISDRKRAAEAKYRRLFETAKDGILILDAAGIINDVNPQALHLLGKERDLVTGYPFWDVMGLGEGNSEGRRILDRLRAGETVRFGEIEYKGAGVPRVLETVGNMYLEGGRQVIQLNVRDVTQRRRGEQQLQQTAKLESLGILAGGIAHDFNNLLTGIMGNASLALLDASGSPRYQTALADVVRASQRAAELTSQMLAYAGKGRYVVKPADMSAMVRDIGSLVLITIPKNVTVEMRLGSGLPAIEADSSQLQQVIMNLVINGAESVEEGRLGFVRVTTALEHFDPAQHRVRIAADGIQGGNFVMLEVADCGVGMDEA
ncbi:MAG: PAS domain S-box protein, partial [Acidobacteriota bacterium]|nr:PAS domain S-box protein [Acidobacteriota bacterium]